MNRAEVLINNGNICQIKIDERVYNVAKEHADLIVDSINSKSTPQPSDEMGIAVKLGCISVSDDGTKNFDIKKFLSTGEGREYFEKIRPNPQPSGQGDAMPEKIWVFHEKWEGEFSGDQWHHSMVPLDNFTPYCKDLAALQGGMGEWRDISSAPRDGTSILIACVMPEGTRFSGQLSVVCNSFWHPNQPGGWMDIEGLMNPERVSLWMPLIQPKPPQSTAPEGEE